eukprot:1111727-Pleurochrysis_carterae.AAC.1
MVCQASMTSGAISCEELDEGGGQLRQVLHWQEHSHAVRRDLRRMMAVMVVVVLAMAMMVLVGVAGVAITLAVAVAIVLVVVMVVVMVRGDGSVDGGVDGGGDGGGGGGGGDCVGVCVGVGGGVVVVAAAVVFVKFVGMAGTPQLVTVVVAAVTFAARAKIAVHHGMIG